MTREEAIEIIEKHGLCHYHEMNPDQPEEKRFEWIIIFSKNETIKDYLELRRRGFSPIDSLAPFSDLLSYNPEESVHTGYDAFRSYFG